VSSIAIGAGGKHTAAYTELRDRARQMEADNRQLIAANEELVCELTRSVIHGCQSATRAAELETELAAVKAANEDLRRATIRAKAEQERLRQAVINARPRITKVDTQLVRPYSPVVALPYTSPVAWVDTSSEDTAELPVLDWPTYPAT
jgi:hypothetical protein